VRRLTLALIISVLGIITAAVIIGQSSYATSGCGNICPEGLERQGDSTCACECPVGYGGVNCDIPGSRPGDGGGIVCDSGEVPDGSGGCAPAAPTCGGTQMPDPGGCAGNGTWDPCRDTCDCSISGGTWDGEICYTGPASACPNPPMGCGPGDWPYGTWDTVNCTCHCPGGAVWQGDTNSGVCSCNDPALIQDASGICVPAGCADSGTWNAANNTCDCQVDGPSAWNGSNCQTCPNSCLSGTMDYSTCTCIDPGCASSGGSWAGGTGTCDCSNSNSGQHWSGTSCQACPTSCGSGAMDNGSCTCSDPGCTASGGTWDSSTGSCDCSTSPYGPTWDGRSCLPTPCGDTVAGVGYSYIQGLTPAPDYCTQGGGNFGPVHWNSCLGLCINSQGLAIGGPGGPWPDSDAPIAIAGDVGAGGCVDYCGNGVCVTQDMIDTCHQMGNGDYVFDYYGCDCAPPCPPNFNYNPANGQCECLTAYCDRDDAVLNLDTCTCSWPECATGMSYNPDTSQCECPDGSTQLDANGNCPCSSDEIWNPGTQTCDCAGDMERAGDGNCMCPEGYAQCGDHNCVPIAPCAEEYCGDIQPDCSCGNFCQGNNQLICKKGVGTCSCPNIGGSPAQLCSVGAKAGQCISTDCGGAKVYDPSTCSCHKKCGAKQELCGGQCVNYQCPKGQTFDSDLCGCTTGNQSCPDGEFGCGGTCCAGGSLCVNNECQSPV